MEIEIQGIPQSLKPSYTTRIKAAKADLARFKKLAKDVHAQLARELGDPHLPAPREYLQHGQRAVHGLHAPGRSSAVGRHDV